MKAKGEEEEKATKYVYCTRALLTVVQSSSRHQSVYICLILNNKKAAVAPVNDQLHL